MSSPVFGNFGIRRLMDQNMRFMRGGLKAWLRIKNFVDNSAFADLGLQFVPSSSGPTVPTGTTDILIDPPPPIKLMNYRTILLAQSVGSSLRSGARTAVISHTWVLAQMKAQWFLNMCANNTDPTTGGPYNNQDPTVVFRGPSVLGIVSDNLLLQQVDITHEEAYGQPMSWIVVCNTYELSNSAIG